MGFVHVITQGECLDSLASRFGFASGKVLYEHADNQELRKLRKNLNQLCPGDKVFIPDRAAKNVACADKKEHTFQATIPKTKLKLTLRDNKKQPYANKRFVATVDGIESDGSTDGEGKLEVSVPPQATSGSVKLFAGEKPTDFLIIPLNLGGMDPIETTSGVQGRLKNLGYACDTHGKLDGKTKASLRKFQKDHKLTETGEIDEATIEELKKEGLD